MLVNEPAVYPKPYEDDILREVLLLEQERHELTLTIAHSPQTVVLFLLFLAKFVNLSGGLRSISQIMWIYST